MASDLAIAKSNKNVVDIDVVLGGDLLNQNISFSYAARRFHLGCVGLYSACATFVESLIVGGCLLQCGINNVVCVSGSHFSTAERQYRYPLELGVLRSPMTQWTATGVGATVVSSEKEHSVGKITSAFIGRVVDFGIMDVNNMGAAMAPSACDTLVSYFKKTNTNPSNYDLILTGDLGKLGKEILIDLANQEGYCLENNYADCGASLFFEDQKTYQGASGAACSSLLFNSMGINGLQSKRIKKMLLLGTGALMSPTASFQGDTVPGITHLVEICCGD